MLKNRRITAIILAIIMTFTFMGQVSVFGLGNGETSQAQEEQNSTQPADGAGETGSTEATEATETTGTDDQEMTIQAEETPEANTLAADDGNVIYQAENLKEVAASGSSTWDGKTIDISWYDPSKESFTISTAAEFAGLAALVNGSYDKTITGIDTGNDTAKRKYIECVKIENFMFVGAGGGNQGGTCYKATGKNDFMGKTIKVTADLNMTAGNYMPIGGKYPMCDANGSMYVNNEVGKGDAHVIEAYFNGILDCSGHTINISCDRYTKSGFPYSMAAGLVGYIGEVIDSDEVEAYKDSYTFTEQSMKTDWAPAVRNVSLKGSVYARRMVGGVVGRIGSSGDSNLGVFVENCANHASVKSTDAKGAGGVVGAGWGTGRIINCYNTGDIESSYGTCPVGGICAENGGMDIYNCYNTGTMSGNSYGRGIGSHDSGSYTINNCYSLKDTNSDSKNPVWYSGTATDIEIKDAAAMSKTDMQAGSFVVLLNSGAGDDNYDGGVYVSDDNNVNNGYPVLYFEKDTTTKDNCTVTIPDVDNGTFKCFYDGKFSEEGSKITVPYGSVIKLYATSDSGYILKNYTAAGSDSKAGDLIGDFVTVTENLKLNADIVDLKKGSVKVNNGTDCTVVATKKGLTGDGTDVKTVKRQKVVSGDKLYQLDVVTVSAYLDENAVPKDPDMEYSGEFEYTYKYEDTEGNALKDSTGDAIGGTSTSGKIVVDENIEGAVLVISAEPLTQGKTWLSFADTSWYDDYDGEGSYQIDSAEDLAGLAYLVNIEGETFSGETIEIPEKTVISLKNTDGRGGTMLWPGIGISSNYNYFAGTFVGNDCTIMDMKRIDKEGSDGGLFNSCSGATIKGIRLRGDTKVLSNGGGIVGSADSCTIENCINYTDVTNQDEKGECAGGIAGRAVGSTINNCINRGDICGYSYVGGIAGNCYAEISNIKNCSNYGEIKTLPYDGYVSGGEAQGVNGTGGICGRAYANIDQCVNFGKIYSTDRCTGGIVGKLDSIISSTAYVSITNSYNNGDIVTRGKIGDISDNAGGAGGIVGYAYKIVIQNAYNSGTVTRSDSGAANNTCVYGVGYFGCGLPTNVSNCYTIDTGVDSWGHTKTPSTVKIAEKTETEMKAETFAKTLGSLFEESADGDYPTLTRFSAADSIEKICTVTFTNDSPSAFAGSSFDINYGGSISLDAFPADNWKKYVFTVGENQWDGKNITKNVTVKVAEKNVTSYDAIFKAAGQTIAAVPYGSGDTYGALAGRPDSSAISSKDGFAAAWPDDVTLDQSGNTIINAVYYPDGSKLQDVQTELTIAKNDDDSVSTYYLGGKSTGTITIAEGAKVKLIGDSGVCEELNIVMEKNSTLTASNLQLLCDAGTDVNDPKSVLTMNEGCTLDLSGSKNYIEGADTDSKECVPAIKVLGDDCVIESTDGDGVLTATAETGDPVIDIADGQTLTFKSGIMKLHKSSKIGSFDGGVINSGRDTVKGTKGTANFTMTGGTLYCTANSDHMHAVKVLNFKMTAGDALITSNDENKALVADNMDIEGGDLHVYSADYDEKESVKTEENRTYYYNKDAIDYTTFTNSRVNKVLYSGMTAPYDVYIMPASANTYSNSSKFACRGLKYKYDVDKDKLVKATDNCLYVWTADSQTAKAVPAGTDMSNDDNVRGYTATTENNNVKVTMTGTAGYRRGWYKACATYDSEGNMLEFKFNKISDADTFTLDDPDYDSLHVFILKDIDSLVPALEKNEKTAN